MKLILYYLIIILTLFGCKNANDLDTENKDYQLVTKISKLIDSLFYVDQNVQKELSEVLQKGQQEKINEYLNKQKNTFNRHIPILKNIYNEIGYPSIEKVGKDISGKFFTLVQHSDSDVKFQKEMLLEIKKELDSGNVQARDFAYLTDRVQLALDKPQVYGTQLDYNTQIGQAFPKNLLDSTNVNQRRNEIGLEPLEVYLNNSSMMHFQVNKAHYDKIGLKEPKLYEIKESQ